MGLVKSRDSGNWSPATAAILSRYFLYVCKGRILLDDFLDGGVEPGLQLRATGAIVYVVLGGQVAGLDKFEFHITRQVDPLFRHPEFDIHFCLPGGKDIEDIIPGSTCCKLAKVVSHFVEEIALEAFVEGCHVIEHPEFSDFL